MSYDVMYVVPKHVYDNFQRQDDRVRGAVAAINIRQLNNISDPGRGKTTIQANDIYKGQQPHSSNTNISHTPLPLSSPSNFGQTSVTPAGDNFGQIRTAETGTLPVEDAATQTQIADSSSMGTNTPLGVSTGIQTDIPKTFSLGVNTPQGVSIGLQTDDPQTRNVGTATPLGVSTGVQTDDLQTRNIGTATPSGVSTSVQTDFPRTQNNGTETNSYWDFLKKRKNIVTGRTTGTQTPLITVDDLATQTTPNVREIQTQTEARVINVRDAAVDALIPVVKSAAATQTPSFATSEIETQTPSFATSEIETQTPSFAKSEIETQTPSFATSEIETQTPSVTTHEVATQSPKIVTHSLKTQTLRQLTKVRGTQTPRPILSLAQQFAIDIPPKQKKIKKNTLTFSNIDSISIPPHVPKKVNGGTQTEDSINIHTPKPSWLFKIPRIPAKRRPLGIRGQILSDKLKRSLHKQIPFAITYQPTENKKSVKRKRDEDESSEGKKKVVRRSSRVGLGAKVADKIENSSHQNIKPKRSSSLPVKKKNAKAGNNLKMTLQDENEPVAGPSSQNVKIEIPPMYGSSVRKNRNWGTKRFTPFARKDKINSSPKKPKSPIDTLRSLTKSVGASSAQNQNEVSAVKVKPKRRYRYEKKKSLAMKKYEAERREVKPRWIPNITEQDLPLTPGKTRLRKKKIKEGQENILEIKKMRKN